MSQAMEAARQASYLQRCFCKLLLSTMSICQHPGSLHVSHQPLALLPRSLELLPALVQACVEVRQRVDQAPDIQEKWPCPTSAHVLKLQLYRHARPAARPVFCGVLFCEDLPQLQLPVQLAH